jgi:hypothetical protein
LYEGYLVGDTAGHSSASHIGYTVAHRPQFAE